MIHLMFLPRVLFGFQSTDEAFKAKFTSELLPFLKAHPIKSFLGKAEKRVAYFEATRDENQSILIISPGRGEFHEKHMEFMYDMYQSGYDIFYTNHRGQAHSERLVAGTKIGHVDSFQDYVDDLDWLVEHAKSTSPGKPVYLFGQSMGGLIAALYLKRFDQKISRAAIASPMFKINTGSIPFFTLPLLGFLGSSLGLAERYFPGSAGDPPDPNSFSHDKGKKSGTSSKVRFDLLYHRTVLANPNLRVGSGSMGWVWEYIKVAEKDSWIASVFSSDPNIFDQENAFETPMLLFNAEQDQYVMAEPQEAFCHQNSACEYIVMKGSRHEIYLERDQFRLPFMRRLKEFFSP